MVEFWTLDERVVGSIPIADLLGKIDLCQFCFVFLALLITKENSDSDIVGWLVGQLVGQSVGWLVDHVILFL